MFILKITSESDYFEQVTTQGISTITNQEFQEILILWLHLSYLMVILFWRHLHLLLYFKHNL